MIQVEVKKDIMETKKSGIYKKFLKRPLDFILALSAIIALSPVILLVALLVKVKLGSPIIFKQERPGLNEKIFTMYKFRTMTDEQDKDGNLLPDTKRLTKFGKFLRSTSLDELPELFNILCGDMSIVGPRPLAVKYLPFYSEVEKLRHHVRPGLTGLAQINGRNTVIWEQRFVFDVEYVNNVSFILDLRIIVKTIGKVLKRSDIGVAGVDRPENFHEYRLRQMQENKEKPTE